MKPLHSHTPLLFSPMLSEHIGAEVYLKLEALQPSGSFKIRGIGHLCQHYASLYDVEMFISSSGGNAGLAVAYAGKQLGLPVKLVVPETTLPLMRERLIKEGAEVIIHGKDWDTADALARTFVDKKKSFYIPPFDHPLLWQGHATLIHEVAPQFKPDIVAVAVGGGGLFCGIMQGLRETQSNHTRIFTAETEGAASLYQAVQAKKLIAMNKINTIATSLGAKKVAAKALQEALSHQVTTLTMNDSQALKAVFNFVNDHRLLVEPACGAALSLIYDRRIPVSPKDKILVVVCGGSAVNLNLLETWSKQLGKNNENLY